MTRPFVNPMLGVPLVESPFFERLIEDAGFDPETERAARDLHRDGLAIIDFPDPDLEAVRTRLIDRLDGRYDWGPWHAGGDSPRLMDEWQSDADVHRIAANPAILDLLGKLYGRRAIPFQTLNFAVGTQQSHHSDSVHFSSVPERFMCGVWLALESIDADNGPLSYFPGSHRLPIYTHEEIGSYAPGDQFLYEPMWRGLVELHGLEERQVRLDTGQAVIWAANLLHGGAPQRDRARTRHSQVTHYYFENCAYYMPHHSDPFRGVIAFKDVVNIATGEHEPNRYVSEDVPAEFIEAVAPPPGYCPSKFGAPDCALPSDFDPAAYLEANPDVAAAGMDAAYHYKRFGRFEGRPLRVSER